MEKIGDRLRRFRMAQNRSVKDVAQFLEIAESTYREWENGRKISGEPYSKLAELFSVEIAEIIEGKKDRHLSTGELKKLYDLCRGICSYIENLR